MRNERAVGVQLQIHLPSLSVSDLLPRKILHAGMLTVVALIEYEKSIKIYSHGESTLNVSPETLRALIQEVRVRTREEIPNWLPLFYLVPVNIIVMMYEAWYDVTLDHADAATIDSLMMYMIRNRTICDARHPVADIASFPQPVMTRAHVVAFLETWAMRDDYVKYFIRAVCRFSSHVGSSSPLWAEELVRMRLLRSKEDALLILETCPSIQLARLFAESYADDERINPLLSRERTIFRTNNIEPVVRCVRYLIASAARTDIVTDVAVYTSCCYHNISYADDRTVVVVDNMRSRVRGAGFLAHIEIAAQHSEIFNRYYTYLHVIPAEIDTPEATRMRQARFAPSIRAELPFSDASRIERALRTVEAIRAEDNTATFIPRELFHMILSLCVLD